MLAFTTGAAAGTAATFGIVRLVWQRAQVQGEAADSHTTKLDALHGAHHDTPRRQVLAQCQRRKPPPCPSITPIVPCTQPMAVPSLLDLRLRRDVSSAWNQGVLSAYDVARRWL